MIAGPGEPAKPARAQLPPPCSACLLQALPLLTHSLVLRPPCAPGSSTGLFSSVIGLPSDASAVLADPVHRWGLDLTSTTLPNLSRGADLHRRALGRYWGRHLRADFLHLLLAVLAAGSSTGLFSSLPPSPGGGQAPLGRAARTPFMFTPQAGVLSPAGCVLQPAVCCSSHPCARAAPLPGALPQLGRASNCPFLPPHPHTLGCKPRLPGHNKRGSTTHPPHPVWCHPVLYHPAAALLLFPLCDIIIEIRTVRTSLTIRPHAALTPALQRSSHECARRPLETCRVLERRPPVMLIMSHALRLAEQRPPALAAHAGAPPAACGGRNGNFHALPIMSAFASAVSYPAAASPPLNAADGAHSLRPNRPAVPAGRAGVRGGVRLRTPHRCPGEALQRLQCAGWPGPALHRGWAEHMTHPPACTSGRALTCNPQLILI